MAGVLAVAGLTVPDAYAAAQQPGPDTIRAAVLVDWPPHYQVSDDGEPTGFAVDVMRAVAERTELSTRFIVFPTFPDALDALRDGRVDVIPDLGIVPFRADEFAFTRPFEAFRLSIFARSSDPTLQDVSDLSGKRVGVVRANAAMPLLREQTPGAELVVFDNVREVLFELVAAGVDAVAYPEEVFAALARSADIEGRIRALPEPLAEISRGMAVAASDTALLTRLNRGVDELVGSPEYELIYERWFRGGDAFWTVTRVVWLSGVLLLLILVVMGLWRRWSVKRLGERLRQSLVGRAQAELARRREERLFETLVEASYEGIVLGDEGNRVAFVNRRICDLLGVEEDDLIGASLLEYVAEEHHARIREGIRRRRQGVAGSYEILLRRPDGGEVWVLLSVAPLMDDDGTFRGSVGTLADISELRQAEEELRESEARFRQIAERIDDVFWITTPDKDHLEYVSPAYTDIWGRSPTELYEDGSLWIEAVHPEDRQRVMDALPQQVQGTYEVEYRVIRPDGEIRWVHDRAFPVRADDGEVVRIVGVAEDITERVEAEQALRERERRFRAFVEHATDLISTLDREGRMQYQSPPIERLLGYEPQELRGRSVFDLIHPDDREVARSGWDDLVAEPGRVLRLPAFRFRHADGSWRTFEATLTNLLEDPSVEAILSNAQDVTEREALEGQLRQSQKLEAVGRLAGGVAHDFNNLLTVIRANTEFLLDAHAPSNPLRDHVDEIRHAASRGADLTRQLLAFSRDQVLQPRPTQLNDVIAAMERLLRRIIGEDIDLTVDLCDTLPAVEIDPGQLEQVIMNLAVNARDAMPDGGRLEVVTESIELGDASVRRLDLDAPGPHVCVTVQDTGIGMDEETRQKIFEPFFTTKAQESGTGLGLATVHGAVRQSGGAIDIESEVGAGTTFHLYFPTTDRKVEERSPETSDVGAAQLEGDADVLVVEDDPGVQRVLQSTLVRYGYAVCAAGSVEQAKTMLAREPREFALILTDLVLPDASGLDLIEYAHEAHPDTRVIVMSGYARHEILEERVLGRDIPFLAKPFTPEGVATIVGDVLGSDARDG